MLRAQIKLNHSNAKSPTRGSEQAAGLDLYSVESTLIAPGQHTTIDTGVSFQLPSGTVGLIWPRSGLAVKHGIDVLAGVIDSDYRGSVKVCLVNHGETLFRVEPGDRIAQLVIQEYVRAEVAPADFLNETNRGEQGFGSTGT